MQPAYKEDKIRDPSIEDNNIVNPASQPGAPEGAGGFVVGNHVFPRSKTIPVMIHRYFGSSACHTTDPDAADLFLVPDYRACHYHLAPTYLQKGFTQEH